MPAIRHSPAYAMMLRGAWRIVVPVRGRLSPQVLARAFASKALASAWLESAEGQEEVAFERAQVRPARAVPMPAEAHA